MDGLGQSLERRVVVYSANGGSEVISASGILGYAAPVEAGVHETYAKSTTPVARPHWFSRLTEMLLGVLAVLIALLAKTNATALS